VIFSVSVKPRDKVRVSCIFSVRTRVRVMFKVRGVGHVKCSCKAEFSVWVQFRGKHRNRPCPRLRDSVKVRVKFIVSVRPRSRVRVSFRVSVRT
jgi:hypothetical protein